MFVSRSLALALAFAALTVGAVAQTAQRPKPSSQPLAVDDVTTLGEDVTAQFVGSRVEARAGDELSEQQVREEVRRFDTSSRQQSAPSLPPLAQQFPNIYSSSSAAPSVPRLPDNRPRLRAAGEILMQSLSPAMRWQGFQMMMESFKPTEEETYQLQRERQRQANEEDYQLERRREQQEVREAQQKQFAAIDAMPGLDDAAKRRVKLGIQLGLKPEQILDLSGLDPAGRRNTQGRRDGALKLFGELQAEAVALGTMETSAARAFDLIGRRAATTGTLGWLMSYVPGSAARQLRTRLDEITAVARSDPSGAAPLSLDQSQDAKTLKQNIRMMLAGRRIRRELRGLEWLVADGDIIATKQYTDLAIKLGNLHMLVSGD